MKIEKVIIMQTLKCGTAAYQKGTIMSGDEITPDIIAEVRAGSPAVSVLLPAPAASVPQPENAAASSFPAKLETENQMLKEQVAFLTGQVEELQERLDAFLKAEDILGDGPEESGDVDADEADGFSCTIPGCDYVGMSEAQLRGHMTKHRKEKRT